MVLGTEHLRTLDSLPAPSVLDPLLHRLRQFAPDIIAVEALPPEEIERLAREATDSTTAAAQLVAAFVVMRCGMAGRLRPR